MLNISPIVNKSHKTLVDPSYKKRLRPENVCVRIVVLLIPAIHIL